MRKVNKTEAGNKSVCFRIKIIAVLYLAGPKRGHYLAHYFRDLLKLITLIMMSLNQYHSV